MGFPRLGGPDRLDGISRDFTGIPLEGNSSFHVGWRTAGGGGGFGGRLIAIFRDFFPTIGQIFILAGRLGTGLSFHGV